MSARSATYSFVMQNLGNRDLSKQEVSCLIDRKHLYWCDLVFDTVRVDDMSKLKKDGTLQMTRKDRKQSNIQKSLHFNKKEPDEETPNL